MEGQLPDIIKSIIRKNLYQKQERGKDHRVFKEEKGKKNILRVPINDPLLEKTKNYRARATTDEVPPPYGPVSQAGQQGRPGY